MSDSQRFRLSRPEPDRRSSPLGSAHAVRWLIRAVLVVAILALAWFQGYSQRGLLVIGTLLVWALLLPVLLRAGGGLLRRAGIEGRLRTVLLVSLALVLLAVFAAVARLLLAGA